MIDEFDKWESNRLNRQYREMQELDFDLPLLDFDPLIYSMRKKQWPPPGEYEYIAVDFDDTLFSTDFPEILAPRKHVLNWCIRQQKKGAKVILYTCREADRLESAIQACRKYGLVFDAVNENPFTSWELTPQSKKPYADIYIDDKAWRV